MKGRTFSKGKLGPQREQGHCFDSTVGQRSIKRVFHDSNKEVKITKFIKFAAASLIVPEIKRKFRSVIDGRREDPAIHAKSLLDM